MIILTGIIILIALFLERITRVMGLPVLLAFILLGMLFGVDGPFHLSFEDYRLTENLCTICLIFIMFYGGFGTKWKTAKQSAPQAMLLSTAGVLLTTLLVGLFCRFVLSFSWITALLCGAVISSTDAASVFSVLRSKHLNLKEGTAPMLEIESGSNDPVAYMLTLVLISAAGGDFSASGAALMLIRQLLFGCAAGILTARAGLLLLGRKWIKPEEITLILFALTLLAYGAAQITGGNGYLSVYLAGLILGNAEFPEKKAAVHFFDALTSLTHILLFFILGLLSTPSRIASVALPAFLTALFLTFIARPLTVFTLLSPFHASTGQKLLVSWSGLRGAASIVFSILVMESGVLGELDLFHFVFMIVLFSIAVQGALLPAVSKWTGMIDENEDVFKTFNDYAEIAPVEYMVQTVFPGHPWSGLQVSDLSLPPDLLLTSITRGNNRVIPVGKTKIRNGDQIVLQGPSLPEEAVGNLNTVRLTEDHEWTGKALKELDLGHKKLIVSVFRNHEHIIPDGNMVLSKNDLLVISRGED